VTSFNQTASLYVEEILIFLYARNSDARISILFDDFAFVNAAMGDMSYEDQLDVGETIMAWDIGSEPSDLVTVTDQAHTGSKAANLTVTNEDEYSGYQDFEDRPLNRGTDTYLDLFWRLEDFTGYDSDLLYLEVYFSDYALAYILANGSESATDNGFDEFIMLKWHSELSQTLKSTRLVFIVSATKVVELRLSLTMSTCMMIQHPKLLV
ncbi:MAG: hypothetical protein ACW968_00220, partial [Candidatus Thorarchaeota archaeon]|jgi:hypothetical protein